MNYVFFSTFYKYITPIFMFSENFYLFIDIIILCFFGISIVIYKYIDLHLLFIILLNVIIEILFDVFLFIVASPFFLFSTKFFQFIFSIHLNNYVYYNKKSATYLTPYILWNFFLTLLTITILFLNISI